MEMLDILNEDGSPTGKQVSKKEAHEKGLWHRAAHVWLVNNNNEILVQKRAQHIESHPGEYDISAAGHLSAGDSPMEGALREVEEELGIKLDSEELIKIGEISNQSTQHEGKYINKEWLKLKAKYNLDFESGGENLVMHPEEFTLLFEYLASN